MPGRVLVVDDDPAVCRLVGDIMEEAGYAPVCIHRDMDAYRALSDPPGFEAIILDINLGPGTTGFDISRFARHISPAVKVVYISGDSSETSYRSFGVPDSRFVAKPLEWRELLEALDENAQL